MSTVADLLKQSTAKETVLKTVQIDGLALLKIMQHCDGALPNIVTGQLLGLDVGQTMEVTDCYPFPVSAPQSVGRSVLRTRAAGLGQAVLDS
jgi:translation initiation factor 3 subunit H